MKYANYENIYIFRSYQCCTNPLEVLENKIQKCCSFGYVISKNKCQIKLGMSHHLPFTLRGGSKGHVTQCNLQATISRPYPK